MKKIPKKPAGQVRLSQLIRTHGPGAMLDLPKHGTVVSGPEFWSRAGRRPISEERLAAYAANFLQTGGAVTLFEPPVDEHAEEHQTTGLNAFLFPLWFLGPVLDQPFTDKEGSWRSRPLLHYRSLEKGRYRDARRKLVDVVPFRFVQACPRGHLEDVDWHAFAQNDPHTTERGPLYLDERGAGNQLIDMRLRCGITGKHRALSNAKISGVLGSCNGRMPWLGYDAWEACGLPARLLVRTASNAYFPRTLPVISIPDDQLPLQQAVTALWENHLQYVESQQDLVKEMKRKIVRETFEALGLTDETDRQKIWAEIQRRNKGQTLPEGKTLKQQEIEVLLRCEEEIGRDVPEGDFYARALPLSQFPAELTQKLERLVLVHRLREVTALLGFTRFEPGSTDMEGELDVGVQLAKLSRDSSELPAVEHRGEGIFIAFAREAIAAWQERPGVAARLAELRAGYHQSLSQPLTEPAYYLLHTLSHLLITALALDCGYPMSALRERIYAGPSGYGILLYTGGAGSAGTLGGLVEAGRRLPFHLRRALELGRLCANDPICAAHAPTSTLEQRYLHGAACHGCVLLPETCCERHNIMLDRALVVPTTELADAAFFAEETP